MSMTKAERTELRSLVRQQFRVLGREVIERRAEMVAQLRVEIDGKFDGERRRREHVVDRCREILGDAQRQITDVLKDEDVGVTIAQPAEIHMQAVRWPDDGRERMWREATARLDATVQAANLKLARQEADLLRDLALGALESDEARSFLATIPTVGELVPAASLPELDA